MTSGFRTEARALLVLGLPLIGSNIAQNAMQMTDALMLGWYDVEALAAVTLAGSFYFIVFILGSGFGWAVTPLVAAAVEAGDTTRARRITRMGLWLSVAYGGIMVLPLIFSEAIFRAIGQAEVVSELGQNYLRIAGWQLVPGLCIVALRAFLSAVERTRIILWVTLLSAVLNVPLNWLLIFGGPFGLPALGERGAAIASLVLTLLSVLILIGYTARTAAAFDLFRRLWRVDGAAMARVAALGLPIGLTLLAEVGLFAASAMMMGWLGPVTLAAHGIALQLASLVFMVYLGLSQAATVRAGRALGRRDESGLRQVARAALSLAGAFAALTVTVFLVLPEPLVSAFIDPDEPARATIVETGVTLLAIAAVFQLVDAGQVIVLGLLRGVQDTRVPMWMAAVSYWLVGLPVAYVLGFGLDWGGVGVWAGLVVGLAAACLSLGVRFFGRAARIGALRPTVGA